MVVCWAAGELLLGVLGSLLQTLQGHGVLTQVDAVLLLELVGHPVDDALIPVVAAQVVIARGGQNLEHAVGKVEDGDIKGAAAQVEDENALVGSPACQGHKPRQQQSAR